MTTVGILFGGVSSEHEVSLMSAASVLRNIDRERYDVVEVGITRDGRWLRHRGPVEKLADRAWETAEGTTPCILSPDRSHKGFLELTAAGPVPVPVDVVFPVLHGKNGEDGTVQGLLALAGIPCVGCGVLGSAVCMDKAVSHTLLVNAGVPKTKLIAVTRPDTKDFEELERRLQSELQYPMFVKPANAGSSVGVTKAKNAVELRDALSIAFAHDRKAVVEQMLTGLEIECAVMGNGEPVASDVIGEIAPTHEFYDYDGKYMDDSTALHVPARIDDMTVVEAVRQTALRAYKALGCAGLARVDFFVDGDRVVLNEINSIPGFTNISMFSKLFEASGVPYTEIVTRLVEYALE